MWLKSALFIFCLIAHGQGKDVPSKASGSSNREVTKTAIPVGEFITSHKIPDDVVRTISDEETFEKKAILKDARNGKKASSKLEFPEKRGIQTEEERLSDFIDSREFPLKRQARVELESFSDAGVLEEDGIKKVDVHRSRPNGSKDSVLPGVYVSNEYPTTMMPILTTPRETRSYDFVPVNIIREDSKDAYASFSDRHFDDLGDVGLVPACTNTRIEVKKGPDGKDYEYEYVYYYYDEDDEGKASSSGAEATKNYETNSRTSSAPRRTGQNASRNKYGTVERSSTVEPASNEVVPNRSGNRGRQLVETDDISEERLPANTRFPPRSRSNHNTGTTEATRTRGNRPRPGLDLVDSSSFRTHQEGPEFPQVLPKGPVRFLGVTPNEDNEEKPPSATRGRGRYRTQESSTLGEPSETPQVQPVTPGSRRRPVTTIPEAELELDKDRSSFEPSKEEDEPDEENVPSLETSKERTSLEEKDESEETELSSSPVYSSTSAITTENPTTTDYPSPMDKVALDLYAFLQQGRNNLMDGTIGDINESSEGTTAIPSEDDEKNEDTAAAAANNDEDEDDTAKDFSTTTELSGTMSGVTTIGTHSATTTTELVTSTTTTTTTTEPTTTTTVATTTTTTTTEPTTTTTTTEPTTTTVQATIGRGKFRRPGVPGGGVGSRTRLKSANGNPTSTTEASVSSEPTQRTRSRFGGSSSNGGGFKRPRPGQKTPQPVEEEAVQKESAGSVAAEKPSSGTTRGRFRGTVGSRSVSTTPASTGTSGSSSSNSEGRVSRPSFNKLNINRKRGRPTTATSTPSSTSGVGQSAEESQEENGQNPTAESATVASTVAATVALSKPHIRTRLPGPGGAGRPPIVRPHGVRPNLRPKPGQSGTTTSTTTAAPENGEGDSLEEPAGEGTEEETHEAPAETNPPTKATTANPLNKLRNRNRLQVHPKATTKAPSPVVNSRRSPLLPRRKPSTEAPTPSTANAQASLEESSAEETPGASSVDPDSITEEPSTSAESSTAASTKHEETRGFGGLLAPRRRIAPRRPGQIISRE